MSSTQESPLQNLLEKVQSHKDHSEKIVAKTNGNENARQARLVALANAGAYAVVIRDIQNTMAGAMG